MNSAQNVSPARRVFSFVLASLLSAGALLCSRADETNTPAATAARTEDATNTAGAFRSYLHLQEQLQAAQLALERNRQESETLAARNAEAIAARLQLIEEAMSSQRARDQETVQSRLAEFMALLPVAGRTALPPPATTETQLVSAGVAGQSSARLFGALTRLEKRIFELEHTAHTPLEANATSPGAAALTMPSTTTSDGTNHSNHLALLLAKGQSLLNLDKAGEALACYDEILAHAPNHPEALVKKGVALEQLRQVEDALRCYDSAIAADNSLTVAYLQKGGLFNRLERYEEALQCYEEALRSQEKARES